MLQNNRTDNAALRSLEFLADNMHGINFALAMRDQDGYLKIYPREDQPCQGGEMRKYKYAGRSDSCYVSGKKVELHGDECTRPDDPRPGDLSDPFPDGIPEAVAICLKDRPQNPEMVEFFLSEKSPYRKGHGGRENIVLRYNEHGDVSGYVFKNTEIDPTVFVNFLQFLRCQDYREMWKTLRGAGMTPQEIAVSFILMGPHDPTHNLVETHSYYFPVKASIRRIVEGDAFDLSGGTFRNRYDYNRSEVQDLFKARKGEEVTIWHKEMSERADLTGLYGMKKFSSLDKYVSAAKEVIADALANPYTDTPKVSVGMSPLVGEVSVPIIEPTPKKSPTKSKTTKKAA